MTTYITKSGDTLGKIAKQYGVGINSITGYKSGNPNVIGIGEKLSINTPKAPAPDYSSIVKHVVTVPQETAQNSAVTLLGNKITAANSSLGAAETGLKNIRTSSYNTAYQKSGLDTIKNNISAIDKTIFQKRQARDNALFQASTDPGFSMAELSGIQEKLARRANAEINNRINERNAMARSYNTGLQEVNRIAGNSAGDALQVYDNARNNLTSLTGQAKDYQNRLMDALKQKQLTNYENKNLVIGLMKAQATKTKASKYVGTKANGWKLAKNPLTGEGMYWYNSSGQTKPLTNAAKKNLGITTATTTPSSSVYSQTPSQPWYTRLYNFLKP